jgi:hypothetical protein
MRKLLVTVCSATAVLYGATPAGADEVRDRAHDDKACAQQVEHLGKGVSPSCLPEGQRPGLESNHNETLVRDAD